MKHHLVTIVSRSISFPKNVISSRKEQSHLVSRIMLSHVEYKVHYHQQRYSHEVYSCIVKIVVSLNVKSKLTFHGSYFP